MSAAKGKIIPSRATARPSAWVVSLLLALAVFVASPVLAKMPHAPRGRTGENALAGTAAVTGGGSVFNAPALQNPGTVNFPGESYDFQYENLSQSPGASEGAYLGTGLMFAGGPLTAGSAALRSVYTAATGVYGAVRGSTSAVNAVNDFQSGNTLGGSLNAAFAALNFGGVGFSSAYPAQSITGYVDNTGNLSDSLGSFAPVSAVPRTVSLNVLNPEFTPAAAENTLPRTVSLNVLNPDLTPLKPGSFSVADWTGYPAYLPRPTGPLNLMEGADYTTARAAADATNNALREGFGLRGVDVDIHEIQPVKFGGSPTDPLNKMILPRGLHRQFVTPFWNQLQKDVAPYVYRAPGG